ncbi:hypothetical protein HBH98_008560 [Parastagonospora nodorum]|nr:hypothetical protein HBH49_030990 [Parastagonospora nodorum]KAH4068929.1 hypothetical protein HBH50_106560 [Parastagonospora nodorum]KAH4087997.1 hypothetical protein HBH48_123520 [Parastagonospora nodorum]KAH4214316.1 hypothetical protein HBI95_006350 [Parastagonospora nodorum]KAH4271177.1 hypothetical protein HBI03_033920 [Parastagonospora nodorum]
MGGQKVFHRDRKNESSRSPAAAMVEISARRRVWTTDPRSGRTEHQRTTFPEDAWKLQAVAPYTPWMQHEKAQGSMSAAP